MSESLQLSQLPAAHERGEVNNNPASATIAMRGLARLMPWRNKLPVAAKTETFDQILPLQEETISNLVSNSAEALVVLETAPIYTLLDTLLSEDALLERSIDLNQAISTDPKLSAYQTLYQAKITNANAYNVAQKEGNQGEKQKLDAEYKSLSDTDSTVELETKTKFASINDKKNMLEKHQIVSLLADDAVAKELLAMLQHNPISEQGPKKQDAPFAHYAANNDESWQVVSNQEVTEYLNQKPFAASPKAREGGVKIVAQTSKPIEIPIALLTSVQGFNDWTGRHGTKSWESKFGMGSTDSLTVIKHYAGLNTDLPPVGEIVVTIMPDGTTFCDNGSGDSHRISAAILRGDKTVKTKNVIFIKAA